MRTKSILTTAVSLMIWAVTHAQQPGKSAFNGAWQDDDNKGFTIMYDGYFNSTSQDSTGKWANVHAGTFTINNDNTVTFKVLYSSFPTHVGSLNTAEYSLTGETLKIHHFKKLINGEGKDVTAEMPKGETQTMTKMK